MNQMNAWVTRVALVGGIAIVLGVASAVVLSGVRAIDSNSPATSTTGFLDNTVALPLAANQTSQNVDPPIRWLETIDTIPWSITDTVTLSDHIAEGTVISVTPARFNTASGSPPAGSNPILDDPDLDAEWMLFRQAVIEITTLYDGPVTTTHLVVPSRGGTFDSNGDGQPDYIYDVSGIDLTDVAVGDKYMIYGVYPWTVPPSQAVGSHWEEQGLAVASSMTANGDPTTFVDTYGAYKIVGQNASSETNHQTVDVTWLRDLTAALTN